MYKEEEAAAAAAAAALRNSIVPQTEPLSSTI
jgi:hypothetical protein